MQVVNSGYEGKLEELQRWELDRLIIACDAVIASKGKTQADGDRRDKARLLKGQIKAEFARRESGARFL